MSGRLTQTFEPSGIKVEWVEFASGPPLFEALNAGSIDLGHAGDAPPLFAQAANIPFVYFGVSSASPDSSAILVKQESNVRGPKDLRGRRIGFTKGSSANTIVLRYLEKQGLSPSEVTQVYLPPADGRAALETGSIDAWAIWDPYLAAAQQGGGYRILTTGRGYVDGREFYFASRRFAGREPQLVNDFLDELKSMKAWAKANTGTVNRYLAADTGIPLPAVALAESRRNRYGTEAVAGNTLEAQEALADFYFKSGLLPRKIDITADVLDSSQEGSK